MTNKAAWLVTATLINVVLLPFTIGVLAGGNEDRRKPLGWRDCCRERGGESYCCYDCCWVMADCDDDRDCQDA